MQQAGIGRQHGLHDGWWRGGGHEWYGESESRVTSHKSRGLREQRARPPDMARVNVVTCCYLPRVDCNDDWLVESSSVLSRAIE